MQISAGCCKNNQTKWSISWIYLCSSFFPLPVEPSTGKQVMLFLYYFQNICINGSALLWLFIWTRDAGIPFLKSAQLDHNQHSSANSALTSCAARWCWNNKSSAILSGPRMVSLNTLSAWQDCTSRPGGWEQEGATNHLLDSFEFFKKSSGATFFSPICALVVPTSFMVTAVKTLSDYNAPQR